jgi:heme ABC exporter ATP-binding subunit CcmA
MTDVAVSLHDAVAVQQQFPLLSGVSLTLSAGSLTMVTGANGSGKTSLLRLLAGLVPLTAGRGTVLGVDLATDHAAVRRRVGWLGHEGSFYRDLTVYENLAFAARALDRPLTSIAPALERVGLAHRRDVRTKDLSAGQRRRVALAWLLVRRAELWLLDEPYASLDDDGRAFFDQLLLDVQGAGATIVLSAHDALRTSSLRPDVIVMAGGRIREAS